MPGAAYPTIISFAHSRSPLHTYPSQLPHSSLSKLCTSYFPSRFPLFIPAQCLVNPGTSLLFVGSSQGLISNASTGMKSCSAERLKCEPRMAGAGDGRQPGVIDRVCHPDGALEVDHLSKHHYISLCITNLCTSQSFLILSFALPRAHCIEIGFLSQQRHEGSKAPRRQRSIAHSSPVSLVLIKLNPE